MERAKRWTMDAAIKTSRAAVAPAQSAAGPRSSRHALFLTLIAALASGACLVACTVLVDYRPLLLIPPVTLVIGWTATRYRNRLDCKLRDFRQHLANVRLGVEAIDALTDMLPPSGELAMLAGDIQQLLRELRHEKKKASELHEEMRQRVASRTDALQRVIGSLRQQASRDALTGLYNRRMMDRYLREVVDRCQAAGMDLAVMMIDIDDFKPLNDTLGHSAGDELLKNVGRIIRCTIREQDAAFRYGGDEFAIILPGTESAGAAALANRLQSLTAGLTRSLRVANPPKLSIGHAQLSELDEPSPQKLLEKADEVLYAQKRNAKHPATNAAV